MIAALAASLIVSGQAGNFHPPIKFVIRHADPYYVKAFLEGRQPIAPEISTLLMMGGPMLIGAAQGVALYQKGYWRVDPTDNSLWLIPTD